jgi:CheY-like chemotaxis protein
MSSRGRILIADDDQPFRQSTADLLRHEGYEVDVADDGGTALALVQETPYDLLITDLRMPGNRDLCLVRTVAQRAGGLPIIIVTGFPSMESALASIELPVAAYLVKPVEVPRLLERIEQSVTRFRSYQVMRQAERRLARWREEFRHIVAGQDPSATRGADGVDAFLALTLRNVMGSLTDLHLLGRALAGREPQGHPCQLVNCPRGAQLQEALRETIAVLEETKSSFKSKRLAILRRKLELLREYA